MNSLNQSELTIIIRDIFRGVVSPKLEKTFNEVYGGTPNFTTHRNRIDQIVDSATVERKTKIMSLVSIAKRPIIDLNVQITVTETGETKYCMSGSDLRKYHMYLPKIHDRFTGRSSRPVVGIRHSRWYPHFMAQVMKNISLHLRMLDLYLKTNRVIITQDYASAETGILGLEVKFDVPTKYEDLFESEDIESDSNPIKKFPGIFVFGKNGVSHDVANQMAKQVAGFAGFEHVFPKEIKHLELVEFIKSPQIIGIGTWNRHARILIKNMETRTVEILDPWKQSIELDILTQFRELATDSGWNVVFVKRRTVDQVRGEGSCVLVAFARLLYIAAETLDFGKYDTPIPDFYAFLASYLYRKNR